MPAKLVSIIIATKNEQYNLPRLLRSIKKQTYSPIEIIVIDNFSGDQTRLIAKKFTNRVYSRGRERSSQRNFGAKIARGAYLFFPDADMELPPTVISECTVAIEKKAFVGVIVPEDNAAHSFFTRIKKLEKRLYWHTDIEAARFFRTTTFAQVAGYNETLIAGEDWDLSQRIKAIGAITRIRTPLIHHETSLKRELEHKWYYARSISRYQRLHPQQFRNQGGWRRILLFWQKRSLLARHKTESVGLALLKTTEFMLFLGGTITNLVRPYQKNR